MQDVNPVSPEEIFRLGMISLRTDIPFDEQENHAVIRDILRDLYLSAKSDEAFCAIAQCFMFMATDHLQSYPIAFDIQLGDRGTEIHATPEKKEGRITYEYPEILRRERDDWHVYFMNMADKASERTTCAAGRKVGAVFVKDKVPLMSGFNGVPPGFPHPKVCARIEAGCKSGEGLSMCPCNHAERNAINLASKHGVVLNGATLYCTTRPCIGCMGDIAVAGIKEVIYLKQYSHDIVDKIAFYGNIPVRSLQEAIDS